jgi:hypothetical protein
MMGIVTYAAEVEVVVVVEAEVVLGTSRVSGLVPRRWLRARRTIVNKCFGKWRL